jgi:hypothetical protein
MRITKDEIKIMKYLKIEDNKGYFLKTKEDSTTEWLEIDKIAKDDLLFLLNQATSDTFEMDVYSEETMANKAHQIIYKNIHEKFLSLESLKSKFKDESESLYKEALDKYTVDKDIQ